MLKTTAAQQRIIENAALVAATRLLFNALLRNYVPTRLVQIVTIHNGQGLTKINRDQAGPYNVYAAGGLVGRHTQFLSDKSFVVIGRKGSAGKPTYAPSGGWVIDTAYYAQPNDEKQLDCEYLFYAISSLDFSDDIISTAIPGINRTSIYRYSIPLPPVDIQQACTRFLNAAASKSRHELPDLPPPFVEQRRIVSRIEDLAAKITEARSLQRQIESDAEFLCRALIFDPSDGAPKPTPMRELVRLRKPNVIVDPSETYHFAGVYCFGEGVFKGQRKSGSEFSYRVLTRLKMDDFIYPKLMAWEGALGIVPKSCDGLHVSPEFPVFEVLQNRILPETLDVYFRTPSVWPELAAISTGTNVRRRRLHPNAFLEFEMPLPSMKTQQRLRVVKASVEEMKHLQTQTAAELDALVPSILAKAFRGEL